MRSSLAAASLLVLAALGCGACGGSGDSAPSPPEEVRAAAAKAAESGNAKVFCRTLVTAHYIQLVYDGDLKACVESEDAVPKRPGKARVSDVRINPGDEAKAEALVRIDGGELDGTAGHVFLVNGSGGWKVNDLGDDYLRATFVAAVKSADEGALSTPLMKACFTRAARTLPAAKMRELTFTGNRGGKQEVTDALLPIAEKCPHALADYGAREFTKGLVEKGKDPRYVRCLQKEIGFFLELAGIVPELLQPKPNFAAVAALEGIVEGAKKNCIQLKG